MTFIGVLLIAAAVAVMVATPELSAMLRRHFEQRLSDTLDTPVTIERVRLHPLRARLEIENIRVLNPPAFEAEPAIVVGRVTAQTDWPTLFKREARLRRVELHQTQWSIRHALGSGVNLVVLARQAQTRAAARKAQTGGGAAPGGETGAGRRVVIDELVLLRSAATLQSNLIPGGKLNVQLEPLAVNAVGEQPVSGAQVTAMLLRSVLFELATLNGVVRPLARVLRGQAEEITP